VLTVAIVKDGGAARLGFATIIVSRKIKRLVIRRYFIIPLGYPEEHVRAFSTRI
jgi:hypothetical protein